MTTYTTRPIPQWIFIYTLALVTLLGKVVALPAAHTTIMMELQSTSHSSATTILRCQCKCRIDTTVNLTTVCSGNKDPSELCACIRDTCLCERASRKLQHLARRSTCLPSAQDGSAISEVVPDWKALASAPPRLFLNNVHQLFLDLRTKPRAEIAVNPKVQTFMRALNKFVTGKEATGGSMSKDTIKMTLEDVSDADLLLATGAAIMERVPPTVFEKTPVNTYELESSAVLAERLSARSLAKFSGDGTIPLHPDVITAFRKIRPEVKDLPIEIAATQQELTASISRVIREETADTAILTGITHTSVVYVHRSAGGNALFLLDSVGAPLLQVKLIRGLRSDPELVKLLTAERFEIFTTLAQRQVADGSCTICALQDIAAMQRLGPEAFLKFAQRTRFEEGNGGSLETMLNTLPGEFYLHAESVSLLRAFKAIHETVAENKPDLRAGFEAAELHPEIVKIMAADSEASSITQANVANLFDAAQSIVARKSDPTAQTEALEELATSLTTLGGELPLDVAEKQSVLDGVNRLGAVTRMQLYTEILMA